MQFNEDSSVHDHKQDPSRDTAGYPALVEDARSHSVHVSELENEWVCDVVKKSDLVLGFDESQPGHWTIFFGRDRLAEIGSGNSRVRIEICGLRYDSTTDELEEFVVAIMNLKGSCDYKASV